jgi:hypothetical protein
MTEQQRHRARIVRKAIESIEEKLGTEVMKPALSDLVRLLQIEKELNADEPREVRVRWIEPNTTQAGNRK